MRSIAIATFLVCFSISVISQVPPQTPQTETPTLVFEVASIKRNLTGTTGPTRIQPGGRFVQTNQPIVQLLGRAYPSANRLIGPVGVPDWVLNERYDINATAGREATDAEMEEMMRTLLKERFQLEARVEERETQVYALVLARSDGRLGPDIQPSTADCARADEQRRAGENPRGANGAPVCGSSNQASASGRVTTVSGYSMATLAQSLSPASGRPVIDRTGLMGLFDYRLRYAIDLAGGRGVPAVNAPTSDVPSVFTAVQEQLGLKLEPSTGLIPVLVVSRIERPTEN